MIYVLKSKIFTAFLFLSLTTLYGHAEDAGEGRIVSNDENSLFQLEKLTETEPIKGYLETCKTNNSNQTQTQLMDCIWLHLDDSEKEQVYESLNSVTDEKSDGGNFDVALANFKTEKTSAAKVLENYLAKQLEEALYGPEDENNLRVANDHTDFYRIYQSQLGKNLISELSAYCIYAGSNGKIPFSDDQQLIDNKALNLRNLNDIDPNTGKSTSFNSYKVCILTIADSCEKNENFSSSFKEDVTSPCELNKLMTAAKIAIEKTTDLIDTFEKTPVKELFTLDGETPTGEKVSTVNQEKLNIQEIVNIGSQELVGDSEYDDALRDSAAEITDNCIGVADAEAIPACKKYLTKKSDNDKISLEYALRNKALTEKVSASLTDPTEENLKSVLKEQGLSDEEYENLKLKVAAEMKKRGPATSSTSCATVEECIKEKIINRYENEREQLTASLQKRLRATEYDDTQNDPNAISKTLENISKKYESSPESIASVYQYSNILSSFIDISSGNSTKSNTAALAAELESNYFSADSNGRQTSSTQPANQATVRDISSLSQLVEDVDDSEGSAVLDANQINIIQGLQTTEDVK